MRRLLRDVAENRPLGDVTTLMDPTVVNLIAVLDGRGRRAPKSKNGARLLGASVLGVEAQVKERREVEARGCVVLRWRRRAVSDHCVMRMKIQRKGSGGKGMGFFRTIVSRVRSVSRRRAGPA